MAYTKYSLTPANNNATPPDGAPEGMLPSAVNDTMRDMMAQIRDVGDGIRNGTYTMTAPVITGGSITGVALSGNTFTNPVITGGSINNTPIGASTANTGAFTTLSASGVATFSAGTVSAPAITTTGDTNTGIFFPAADTIAFTEGGVESMRIDSSGNVGIGTSSFVGSERVNITFNSSGATTQALNTRDSNASANGNYHIVLRRSDDTYLGGLRRVGTDNAMGVDGNAYLSLQTTGTERMRIDSSGNVGIGTASPNIASGFTNFVVSDTDNGGIVYVDRAGGARGYFYANGTSSVVLGNTSSIPLVFNTADTERMRITSGGELLLGTTNSNYYINSTNKFASIQTSSSNSGSAAHLATAYSGDVGNAAVWIGKNDNDSTTSQIFVKFLINATATASGQINANGASSAAFGTWSDARLKDNITNLPSQLENILSLRPVEFDYKDGSGHQIGFIAQEMQEVYPDVVGKDEKEMLTITGWDKTTARLVKAIQEMKSIIDEQAARISALESK